MKPRRAAHCNSCPCYSWDADDGPTCGLNAELLKYRHVDDTGERIYVSRECPLVKISYVIKEDTKIIHTGFIPDKISLKGMKICIVGEI